LRREEVPYEKLLLGQQADRSSFCGNESRNQLSDLRWRRYDYSRSALMGNSGLTIFREADFGNEMGLSLSIDGIPVTTLSRGEGYRAMIRPGRHVLTVTNTPSPYGKTKFTHRTVDFVSGRNYSFTALWEVESILLEDGGYVYHGFYR
jgi:hypothetical protein